MRSIAFPAASVTKGLTGRAPSTARYTSRVAAMENSEVFGFAATALASAGDTWSITSTSPASNAATRAAGCLMNRSVTRCHVAGPPQ